MLVTQPIDAQRINSQFKSNLTGGRTSNSIVIPDDIMGFGECVLGLAAPFAITTPCSSASLSACHGGC